MQSRDILKNKGTKVWCIQVHQTIYETLEILVQHKIGALEDFDVALRKFSAGDEVNVVVLRGGKRVNLKVKLAKPH